MYESTNSGILSLDHLHAWFYTCIVDVVVISISVAAYGVGPMTDGLNF